MSITNKRQAIADALVALDSITTCPRTVTRITTANQLPSCIVQFVAPSQVVVGTGGSTDNEYTFALDLVFNATDENKAVESMEEAVDDVLGMQRTDPTFSDAFVDSRIEGGGEPRFERASEESPNATPLLVVRLYVIGMTEEG